MKQFNKIKFAWARLFHTYGNNEPKDKLVSTVLSSVEQNTAYEFTASNQVIDLSHVEHVANDVILLALGFREGVFNVCSGQPQTVKEIVNSLVNEKVSKSLFTFSEAKLDNALSGIRNV